MNKEMKRPEHGRGGGSPPTPQFIGEFVERVKKMPGGLQTLDKGQLVDFANKMGEHLARGVNLKMNQVRKFLDTVNRIRTMKGADYQAQSVLLLPKLAYAAGRTKEVRPLLEVLEPAIRKVKERKDFDALHQLVESIVAYHKFFGGRD